MALRLATWAMGTRFELVLDGDGPGLRAAGEAALAEVEECDRLLSLFERDSLVSHLNRWAAERPVRVDLDTFDLLATCADIHAASGGAFDVTVAPLMESHGFRPERSGGAVGGDRIDLDPTARTVRFAREGLRLDLGAIAKGHALDLAAAVLRESGVESALLHGGTSTVVALGAPPGLDGWRVALEPGDDAPCAVLRDEALSVSAQHGRTNARGQGHVMDPRRASPAETTDVVAVVAPSARIADGWSTALLVLGELPASVRDLSVLVGAAAAPDPAGRPRPRRWQRLDRDGPPRAFHHPRSPIPDLHSVR